MANISNLVNLVFILTTIVTLWLFYKASGNKKVILGILAWMFLVGILGYTGFYREGLRFALLLGPVFIFIIMVFSTEKGQVFASNLDLKWLTLLHSIRIPVEIVLLYIFLAGLIPKIMTFEGFNYDILSGITAPILYYFVFIKKKNLGKTALLIWNIICLVLIFNIVTIAVLSAETPLQQLGFHQPNIGVTYFPFVWLPTVVVPIVIFSHMAAIKQLLATKKVIKGKI